MSVQTIIEKPNIKVKAAFGLAIAEMVVDALKSDEEGYRIAQEALNLSWEWIENQRVAGDTLAQYVDSPTEKDLGVREEYYDDNRNMISALVVLTLAIGLVAHFAYEVEGNRNRPTPIWETNEESLRTILEFASNIETYDENTIDQIEEFLLNNDDTIEQKIDRHAVLNIVYSKHSFHIKRDTDNQFDERPYPNLKYFFSAYFHQDWKLGYDWQGERPSFQAVVHDFKKSNPKEIVVKTIQELDQLLTQDLTEDILREIVSHQLGSEIYVASLGLTYRAWLNVILTVLNEE